MGGGGVEGVGGWRGAGRSGGGGYGSVGGRGELSDRISRHISTAFHASHWCNESALLPRNVSLPPPPPNHPEGRERDE